MTKGKRGGKTTGTWPKGKKPPVKKPRGARHRSTIIKEELGLKNWEGVKTYLQNAGATKLIKEMSKLKGISFVRAFAKMNEYVLPKLSRVDFKEDPNPNESRLLDPTKLTADELSILISLVRKAQEPVLKAS